jgi:oligopeptide/dipeptide ABC transporter ATP-binding protein
VLQEGRIVEHGATAALLTTPAHPYTAQLLASVPRLP